MAHLVLPDEVQEQVAPDGVDAGRSRPDASGRVRWHRPPMRSPRPWSGSRGPSARSIVVGNGARRDMASIVTLAETLGAPVVTTFKAKGQIGDDHPLGCGVLGRSGTPIASWFMNESDLIVVFGASFSNHTGIAPYKPLVQVDDDPMALGRFHAVDVPVLGDVGVTARALLDALPCRSALPGPDR